MSNPLAPPHQHHVPSSQGPFTGGAPAGMPPQYGSQPAGPQQPYGSPPAGGNHFEPQPNWGPGPGGAATSPRSSGGFFRALFDLKFDPFLSITAAGIIYVLHIIGCVLTYLTIIIWGIALGFTIGYDVWGDSSFQPPLIPAIVFGWIPALLQLVYGRMLLEFIVASIKTAENTRKISEGTKALTER